MKKQILITCVGALLGAFPVSAQLKVHNQGRVTVGGIPPLGYQQSARLFINGPVSGGINNDPLSSAFWVYQNNVADKNVAVGITASTNASTYPFVISTPAAITLFHVRADGSAYLKGALTSGSDSLIKRDIQPLRDVTSDVMKLNFYSYRYTRSFSQDSTTHYGVLAHELKRVYPGLVSEISPGLCGVNYIDLIPVALASLKELHVKEMNLSAELLSLKKEYADMRDSTGAKASFGGPAASTISSKTTIAYTLPKKAPNSAYIYLFNVEGKLLHTDDVKSGSSVSLDPAGYDNGLYFISMFVDDQEIGTQRILIKK